MFNPWQHVLQPLVVQASSSIPRSLALALASHKRNSPLHQTYATVYSTKQSSSAFVRAVGCMIWQASCHNDVTRLHGHLSVMHQTHLHSMSPSICSRLAAMSDASERLATEQARWLSSGCKSWAQSGIATQKLLHGYLRGVQVLCKKLLDSTL